LALKGLEAEIAALEKIIRIFDGFQLCGGEIIL
jgi:hypothetical protein